MSKQVNSVQLSSLSITDYCYVHGTRRSHPGFGVEQDKEKTTSLGVIQERLVVTQTSSLA